MLRPSRRDDWARTAVTTVWILLVGVTGAGVGLQAQDGGPSEIIESGRDTYVFHCASCHGRTGKGDGPVAASLKLAPPNLTTLARRAGGRFPEAQATAFIVGRRPPSHGSPEMPVWGPLFQELNPFDSKVDVRLSRLIAYLESIQVK